MRANGRVPFVLLLLRLSVFLVMFMWTLDKFFRPEHAAAVYETFYLIGGLGKVPMYLFGAIELLVLVGFLLGYRKGLTYGAVLVFHAVSTLSAFKRYLAPFTDVNLLFYAAWPMLAACFALFYLRDLDVRWTIKRSSSRLN